MVPSGKGAGGRLKLRPWQIEIIVGIYGQEDKDGLRLVRECVVSMPRKNGKTLLISCLVLCHLIGPEAEKNGEIYSAAANKEQAATVFKYCSQIIDLTPELIDLKTAGQLRVNDYRKRIVFFPLGTYYQALSKAADTKHGANPSVVICDELAQWKNAELYDVLTSAFGARAEPLTLVISTQAPNDEHLLSQLIDYGEQVRAGAIDDPTFRLFLWAAEKDADPFDPAVWLECNPALGDFLTMKDMETQARRAQEMKNRKAPFQNLRLNMRVDSAGYFIDPAVWDANAADPDTSPGRAWAATDLGVNKDMTSIVVVVERMRTVDASGDPLPKPELQALDVMPYFWLPEDNLRERSKEDRVPYMAWKEAGFLRTTPGPVVNRDHVAKELFEILAPYDLQGLAYDRFRIEELRQRLADHGDVSTLNLVSWGQGFVSMAPAVDELDEMAALEKLRHGGHPVLRWCMSNVKTNSDPAGNQKMDKKRSLGRIDGAQSLAMALGLRAKGLLADPPPPVIGEDYEVTVI